LVLARSAAKIGYLARSAAKIDHSFCSITFYRHQNHHRSTDVRSRGQHAFQDPRSCQHLPLPAITIIATTLRHSLPYTSQSTKMVGNPWSIYQSYQSYQPNQPLSAASSPVSRRQALSRLSPKAAQQMTTSPSTSYQQGAAPAPAAAKRGAGSALAPPRLLQRPAPTSGWCWRSMPRPCLRCKKKTACSNSASPALSKLRYPRPSPSWAGAERVVAKC
jgi:hypothetical protein